MNSLPVVLFAVADTGTWSLQQLRRWADGRIEAIAEPADWLFDLSFSRTSENAIEAIRGGLVSAHTVLPYDIANLLVGLIYLRFQRGEIARGTLVANVADVIDAYESSVIDIEGWYAEMDADEAVSTSLCSVLERLAEDAEEAMMLVQDSRPIVEDDRRFLEG